MRAIISFLSTSMIGGLLVIGPIWFSVFLLAQVLSMVRGLMHPLAAWLPDQHVESDLIAFGVLLLLCFMAGLFLQTRFARSMAGGLEDNVLIWIPGYRLLRSLLRRMRGEDQDHTWAVALVEIEEALVPAFVVEELPDGQYTIFVPSVPTPAAGAIYIMEARRVHFVDVPFVAALSCIAKWGVGSSVLFAALKRGDQTASGR